MKKETIAAINAWQSSLVEIQPRHGGFSCQELADELGVHRVTALMQLRKMLRAGKVKFVGREPRPDLTGRMQLVPVYRVV